MSEWLDRKYINLVSSQLRNFKWQSNKLARASCPICGDSNTNKLKARFYFISKQGRYYTYCHNCHATMSIGNLIKKLNVELFDDYTKESLLEKYSDTPSVEIKSQTPVFNLTKNTPLKDIKKVSQLVPDHPCKLFVTKRHIPTNTHYKLFYCEKFNEWVNKFSKRKVNTLYDEPRLVIPFFDRDGTMFALQGRSLKKNSNLRYITLVLDESKPKIYGLDKIDFTKKFYIVEGPIDSLFLPNCIAMAGSDIDKSLINNNGVFVYDNEPRNKEIIQKIEKTINAGYKVVIWPSNIDVKDINDMVLANIDISKVIETNTFSGIEATLKLTEWKRA